MLTTNSHLFGNWEIIYWKHIYWWISFEWHWICHDLVCIRRLIVMKGHTHGNDDDDDQSASCVVVKVTFGLTTHDVEAFSLEENVFTSQKSRLTYFHLHSPPEQKWRRSLLKYTHIMPTMWKIHTWLKYPLFLPLLYPWTEVNPFLPVDTLKPCHLEI